MQLKFLWRPPKKIEEPNQVIKKSNIIKNKLSSLMINYIYDLDQLFVKDFEDSIVRLNEVENPSNDQNVDLERH